MGLKYKRDWKNKKEGPYRGQTGKKTKSKKGGEGGGPKWTASCGSSTGVK